MNYMEMSRIFIFIILSYLIGSIPFAWLMARVLKKGDIRKQGTGNAGGGNVMLVAGKLAGVFVLLLDMSKGAFAAWMGLRYLGSEFGLMACGIAAVIGHCNSIFLNFTGGKGVATILGIYAVIDLRLFLFIYFIWAALVLTTKYSSINTVIMSVLYPFILCYLGKDFFVVIFSILAAMIMVINHRDNIADFIAGREKTMREEIVKAKRKGRNSSAS
jgi:glycerol-3-phosphate acyltransferase PlsY